MTASVIFTKLPVQTFQATGIAINRPEMFSCDFESGHGIFQMERSRSKSGGK